MGKPPILETDRLMLRPFTLADAPAVQEMVSDRDVAATTFAVPHPYPEGGAQEWIRKQPAAHESGQRVTLAITLRKEQTLIGSINLRITAGNRRAEMGYLIGKAHWGNGYATEAAAAMVRYAFDVLDLSRVYAHHMTINPASGRVLEKIGMKRDGDRTQTIKRLGEDREVVYFGMTREEWETKQQHDAAKGKREAA
jgi:RimJ/RimL family protein N-acetyltransferase